MHIPNNRMRAKKRVNREIRLAQTPESWTETTEAGRDISRATKGIDASLIVKGAGKLGIMGTRAIVEDKGTVWEYLGVLMDESVELRIATRQRVPFDGWCYGDGTGKAGSGTESGGDTDGECDVGPAAAVEHLTCYIRRWLFDTGCGHDLVPRYKVLGMQDQFRSTGMLVTFGTANGATSTNEWVPMRIEILNATADAYVLEAAPPVLSTSKRCMEGDNTFIRANRKDPFLWNMDGTLVKLKVDGNIPYLYPGHSLCRPVHWTAVRGEYDMIDMGGKVYMRLPTKDKPVISAEEPPQDEDVRIACPAEMKPMKTSHVQYWKEGWKQRVELMTKVHTALARDAGLIKGKTTDQAKIEELMRANAMKVGTEQVKEMARKAIILMRKINSKRKEHVETSRAIDGNGSPDDPSAMRNISPMDESEEEDEEEKEEHEERQEGFRT